MDLSPAKVAHVIVRAREYDVKVAAWGDDQGAAVPDDDADTILEDLKDDATRNELSAFIAGMNVDEQVELVALAWVGRGTYTADEWGEAVETARGERVNKTEDYLLGIPLLADYLEEGLEAVGVSVEDAEQDIL